VNSSRTKTGSPPEIYEFEVHVVESFGYGDVHDVVKILVASDDWWDAYRTAVATAWRGDRQVVACLWVP
jgi:hypothetical protein